MQECRLDIKVLDIPVKDGSDMEEGVDRFETSSGSSRLIVVDTVPLGEALYNISHFVTRDVALIISFAFADKFPFEGTLSAWHLNARNQDEDRQVSKTL